jgi:hypothetical protein
MKRTTSAQAVKARQKIAQSAAMRNFDIVDDLSSHWQAVDIRLEVVKSIDFLGHSTPSARKEMAAP